jgi:hypothetical protein
MDIADGDNAFRGLHVARKRRRRRLGRARLRCRVCPGDGQGQEGREDHAAERTKGTCEHQMSHDKNDIV